MNQALTAPKAAIGNQSFNAHVQAFGADVSIHASTLEALLKTLQQFGYVDAPSANDAPVVVTPKPKKEAPAPSPAPAPAVEKAAATEVPGKSESAAPAAAPSVASTKADASVPDYAKVKDAVIALAKTNRDLVISTLAGFGVDHGSKLAPEQYAPFIEAANKAMAGAAHA